MFQRIFGMAARVAVVLAGGLVGGQAWPALGAPVLPSSYDMANGHGHVTGGWYNYWDGSYDGAGNPSVDNSPLSGGLGDLSDGNVATQIWDDVENHEGTGPYVGWINVDPTIVFHFDGDPLITSVIVHTDDSLGQGGVSPPWEVVINGDAHAVALPRERDGAPFAIVVDGLALRGDVTVQLVRRWNWVFVSEVQFEGAVGQLANTADVVAEPGTLALMAAGMLGLMGVRRRRARG